MAADIFAVEITEGAEADLEAIHAYLAAHRSTEEANALLDDLLEKAEALEKFPYRGVIPKELDRLGMSEFRQILSPPYRIIYRVIEPRVFILVVADGRRDMQALLERRLLGGN